MHRQHAPRPTSAPSPLRPAGLRPLQACARAALALGILAATDPAIAARLDRALEHRLQAVGDLTPVEVIVTFEGTGAPDADDIALLSGLGLDGITLRSLPIAGVLANRSQVEALLADADVRSVWFNAPLAYENLEATALTSVDRLRGESLMRSQGLPVSGRGVGVLINDSGVDGTHADLQYPEHVVQNVAAQTNLHSLDALLPITYTENVPNTDIAGGHGTHVAGIVGGTGARSDGGRFEGVAPGADIVGYGSGAGLFILDTLGGFDYALTHQFEHNIRVVSNSFGNTGDTGTAFDPDDPTNVATKALADRGVVVVFSAGNAGSGEATITGNFKKAPWVVTVAAGDKGGRLSGYSSRGVAGGGGSVEIDGESYTWVDRPTVTAPGTDIYSARASTSDGLDLASMDQTIAEIGPAQAPFYTKLSGTSMAAPHVSGVVALMLEANPALGWQEVKQILQETATNVPGRADWEAGAGYVNAYAAVQAALGAGEFGSTVNALRTFNAEAIVSVAGEQRYDIAFSPAGPTESVQFDVAPDVSLINARANVGDGTVALSLTDPAGNRYGSSIALPLIGQSIAVAAPGRAGTWTLTVRGIGAVSGVDVDPLDVTNGISPPTTVTAYVKQLRTDGFRGLGDIASHPARGFIEAAVSERLVDATPSGFQPDATLTRGVLADFLVMGAAARQSDPLRGASFADIAPGSALYAAAEAAGGRGAALKDVFHAHAGLVATSNGRFDATAAVTREQLAYSLVQALGLEDAARAHSGDVTAIHGSDRIVLADQSQIAPSLRGYVQLALDLALLPARFSVSQGPFDLQPKVSASFAPRSAETRAGYAAAATRFLSAYDQGGE